MSDAPPAPEAALDEYLTSGRRFMRWNAGSLLLAALALGGGLLARGAGQAGGPSAPADGAGVTSGWDDGRVEVARYDARQAQAGPTSPLLRITAREPRAPASEWQEGRLPWDLRGLAWGETPSLEVRLATEGPAGQGVVGARIERVGEEELSVPAGRFACYHLRVVVGERRMDYWVGQAPPHPLVRYEDSTGQGELRSLERLACVQDVR